MTHQVQLLVIAKEPRPGHSKTRLSPALSPADAARVARASLLDTLAAVAATDVVARTVVLDGSPDGWLPHGFDVIPQVTGTLNDRLEAAFSATFAHRSLPALLVGMDTPQVTPTLLSAAIAALLAPGTDAVLGHAADGGWWAIGLRAPHIGLFDGVPMSTGLAGAAQRQRLDDLGLRTTELPLLRDIDHVEDLHEVAGLMHPSSHLATVLAAMTAAV